MGATDRPPPPRRSSGEGQFLVLLVVAVAMSMTPAGKAPATAHTMGQILQRTVGAQRGCSICLFHHQNPTENKSAVIRHPISLAIDGIMDTVGFMDRPECDAPIGPPRWDGGVPRSFEK